MYACSELAVVSHSSSSHRKATTPFFAFRFSLSLLTESSLGFVPFPFVDGFFAPANPRRPSATGSSLTIDIKADAGFLSPLDAFIGPALARTFPVSPCVGCKQSSTCPLSETFPCCYLPLRVLTVVTFRADCFVRAMIYICSCAACWADTEVNHTTRGYEPIHWITLF